MTEYQAQSLCFDDIEKGQEFLTSDRVVTGQDVMDFARLTGDHNRLHTDPEYAKDIAFGHPNGASGGRIAIAAVRQLERRGGRYGLVASCCGGGLGVSALFERI